MKTYNGEVQLVLTDADGGHPVVIFMAALTLDTPELASQALDWQGTLFGSPSGEILLGSMFNTWIRVPGVDRDVRCYIEELRVSSDEVRISVRDHDPANPLSKRITPVDIRLD